MDEEQPHQPWDNSLSSLVRDPRFLVEPAMKRRIRK